MTSGRGGGRGRGGGGEMRTDVLRLSVEPEAGLPVELAVAAVTRTIAGGQEQLAWNRKRAGSGAHHLTFLSLQGSHLH